jgi:hypothetical protein
MHNVKHNSTMTLTLLQRQTFAISTNEATITTGNEDDPCNVNKVTACDVATDTSAVLTEM